MRFNVLISVLAAATLMSPVAFAKPAAASANEVYKLDIQASTLTWVGHKATGAEHTGSLKFKEGQIEVANKEFKGGNFSADMSSLTDKDLEGNPEYKNKLETHLKSEDFFNVAKFPESTFKITSVTKKSATEVMIKGDLTMIGKTQAVDEFPATIKMEGNKMMGTANIKIDRTKWGLKYGSGKFFKNLGDKMIGDEFDLKLNLTAVK